MAVTVTIQLRDGEHIHESKADLSAARAFAREATETGVECNDDTRYIPAARIREVNVEA